MSVNLFYEARGEPSLGQQWVMHVTNNRVNDPEFPNDFCSVISQHLAYSWKHQLRFSDDYSLWSVKLFSTYKYNKIEMNAWSDIVEKATHFYFNRESLQDITNGSICYMTFDEFISRNFEPHCPRTEYYGQVNNHVFFIPKR